jgi:hypothetical protein
MQCIKTGCDAYIVETGEFIHGDGYLTKSGDLVIRTSGTGHKPMSSRRHFTIMLYEHWFDERSEHTGTMLIERELYT